MFARPGGRSYTSLLLEGMARNYFSLFIYMDIASKDHAIYCVWIRIFFLPPMPKERRNTSWSELESNPGLLSSQATALTTRPCLLGQTRDVFYNFRLFSFYLAVPKTTRLLLPPPSLQKNL